VLPDARDPESSSRRISVESLSDDAGKVRLIRRVGPTIVVTRSHNRRPDEVASTRRRGVGLRSAFLPSPFMVVEA